MPSPVSSSSPGDGDIQLTATPRVFERLRSLERFDRLLCGAVALGIFVRVILILCSRGSNDMLSWEFFASTIVNDGLWVTYEKIQLFNHPPLMGWMAQTLKLFSQASGIPFRILFKLPVFAADLICLGILWKTLQHPSLVRPFGTKIRTALLAMAIFACNPVSILVTAFHGNTDSLCAVLGLAAAVLHFRGRWWLAGLVLAGSVNVKIVGLMWAPALFFLCPTKLIAARFVGGFLGGMLPFLGPLIACPEAFHRNAIAYNSVVELWGINVLSIKLWDSMPEIAQPAYAYREWGRYLIIAAIVVGAAWARIARLNVLQSAAASMGLFLVLTPGFGVQYTVWVVPVLAATAITRSALFAAIGGLFVGWIYSSFLTKEFPFRSDHRAFLPDPIWLAGVAAWGVVLFSVVTLLFPRLLSLGQRGEIQKFSALTSHLHIRGGGVV